MNFFKNKLFSYSQLGYHSITLTKLITEFIYSSVQYVFLVL